MFSVMQKVDHLAKENKVAIRFINEQNQIVESETKKKNRL